MSIFEQLASQQREIRALFCDTRRANAIDQRALALLSFRLAATKLIACMRAKHAVVYPRFADVVGLVAEVSQARHDHEAIEDSINRLRLGGLDGDAWDAELDHLIRRFDRHADLEELSMFPIAGLSLTSRELVTIGVDFAAYLARTTPVAGASITYRPAPVAAFPRTVHIAAAPLTPPDPTNPASLPVVLAEVAAIDAWDPEYTSYELGQPEAA